MFFVFVEPRATRTGQKLRFLKTKVQDEIGRFPLRNPISYMALFAKPKRGAQVGPTSILHVAGIGERLGDGAEEVKGMLRALLELAQPPGSDPQCVHMASGASYCFVEFASADEAHRALDILDSAQAIDDTPTLRTLRATFVVRKKDPLHSSITCTSAYSAARPEGLQLVLDFISPAEELSLLAVVNQSSWDSTLARRVKHFGYTFSYGLRGIDFSAETPPIPGAFIDLEE